MFKQTPRLGDKMLERHTVRSAEDRTSRRAPTISCSRRPTRTASIYGEYEGPRDEIEPVHQGAACIHLVGTAILAGAGLALAAGVRRMRESCADSPSSGLPAASSRRAEPRPRYASTHDCMSEKADSRGLRRRAARRVGRQANIWLSRRRHQWRHGRAATCRRRVRLRAGRARGARRAHGDARTRSSPARSASVSRPAGRARSICSTDCTTPSSITRRSSRSSASRTRRPRWRRAAGDRSCAAARGRRQRTSRGRDARAGAARGRPRDAHRRSASEPCCCIILPNDVQRKDAVQSPPHEHGMHAFGNRLHAAPRMLPRDEELRARRRSAQRGEEGRDARRRGRARRRRTRSSSVAELLGAGVAKALLGKAGAARRSAVRHRIGRMARHARRAIA